MTLNIPTAVGIFARKVKTPTAVGNLKIYERT